MAAKYQGQDCPRRQFLPAPFGSLVNPIYQRTFPPFTFILLIL